MNAIELMEAFGNGGQDDESNDYMIDSLSAPEPAKNTAISNDKRKVRELAFDYYKIKKDQSGWSQHRTGVVYEIASIFKAHDVEDGYYNLTNKTYFHYNSGGKSTLNWGQKEQLTY